MGNTLQKQASFKRRSKNKPRSGLSGLEIVLDQPQEPMVSEMFQEGFDADLDYDYEDEKDHIEDRDYSMQDYSSDRRVMDDSLLLRKSHNSRKSVRSSRTSTSSRRLSASEGAEDLMTCMIPGMDPLEMLRLVEGCVEEDEKEREIEEARLMSKRNLYSKSKDRSSRRRKRSSMTSGAA
ncbi:expressed unknown protein [Seminavis robusta]|uniref:Uncharacterized protein n=1 Tax=Seminavis robusta TaxID=568900 RepID=A0A9N8DXD4_9STRA|nr:expressed unknown protein [Seminavis robusta]|eukprot:Sro365_g127360.1 n/a (179) ;mRNA; f:31490-32026